MLNDAFQGYLVGLGFVLGGTPEFLLDAARPLQLPLALQNRLAEKCLRRVVGSLT